MVLISRKVMRIASVFDVADYILEKQGEMSSLKLQRLCYYCQAWSLAWDNIPLFEEDFETWGTGTVCRELYSRTEHIEGKLKPVLLNGNSSVLTKKQKETIDSVLNYYGSKEGYWLSDLIKMEEPWKKARYGIPPGKTGRKINKKDMQEYYSKLNNTE